MVYSEFKRHLAKAGITAREFAELVRLHPNSITNYAKLRVVPSHWAVIATLMAEMAEQQLDFRAALARIEIEPNKPRGAGAKGRFGGAKQIELQLRNS